MTNKNGENRIDLVISNGDRFVIIAPPRITAEDKRRIKAMVDLMLDENDESVSRKEEGQP